MALMRTICSKTLDLQTLRQKYSFDLCGLLAKLLAKQSTARPSARAVLAISSVHGYLSHRALPTSVHAFSTVEERVTDGPPQATGEPQCAGRAEMTSGTDAHAAAAVLQRSFHRHRPTERKSPRSVIPQRPSASPSQPTVPSRLRAQPANAGHACQTKEFPQKPYAALEPSPAAPPQSQPRGFVTRQQLVQMAREKQRREAAALLQRSFRFNRRLQQQPQGKWACGR